MVVASGNNTNVFTKTAEGWRPTGEIKNIFIEAFSGNTMVGAEGQGLYVFTKTTNGWQETAELEGSYSYDSSGPGDESVGVSGNTIVVGDTVADRGAGGAYVFTKTAAGWVQTAELVGSDTVPIDLFGYKVAISGGTIVVGAPMHASKAGRAFVFKKSVAAGCRRRS